MRRPAPPPSAPDPQARRGSREPTRGHPPPPPPRRRGAPKNADRGHPRHSGVDPEFRVRRLAGADLDPGPLGHDTRIAEAVPLRTVDHDASPAAAAAPVAL